MSLDENVCLQGGAGAGKTSVAREIARVALDREESCIYFPCVRLDASEKTLPETILEFLRGLSGTGDSTKNLQLDKVKWIILDGCDEASIPSAVLSDAIAKIAFPTPMSVAVKHPGVPVSYSSFRRISVPEFTLTQVRAD